MSRASETQNDYNYLATPKDRLHSHLSAMKHHSHHHRHSYQQAYSPSSKSADISRLLDPTYTTSSASSSSTYTAAYRQPTVYVDHRGDFHDPDFRYFPDMTAITQSPTSRREKRKSSDLFTPSPYAYQEAQLEDEEDDEERENTWQGRRSSTTFNNNKRRTGRSMSPANHYHSSYISPTSTIVASPTSYSIPPTPPLSSSPESYISSSPTSSASSSPRKLSKPMPRTSIDECAPPAVVTREYSYDYYGADDEQDAEDEESRQLTYDPSNEAHDHVPTCTQSLKKEWQTVALSVRLGLFRMKRRVRTALT